MATTSILDKDLNNIITRATSPAELIPILEKVSLSTLKDVLKSEISRKYPTALDQNKFKFQVLFFSRVIPDDVMQYVLLFLSLSIELNCHRQVCRKWKKLDNKNQKLFYKPYMSKYTQMYIFDSRRIDNKVTAFEETLGIKGAVGDLRNILNSTEFMKMTSKDKAVIFVFGGTQELEEQDDRGGVLTFKRNCRLIGVNHEKDQLVEISATINGKHYESNYDPDYTGYFMCVGSYDGMGECKVEIEGINFNNNFLSVWGQVYQGCSLLISNCKMFAQDGGIHHNGNELQIDNCHIEVGGVCLRIGYDSEIIKVANSTLFNTYDRLSCIEFDGHLFQHNMSKLECKGNTFITKDEDAFPICDEYKKDKHFTEILFMGYLSQNTWWIASKKSESIDKSN